MTLKTSQSFLQENNPKDFENLTDYPTLEDLMKEQNISSDKSNTVHHRRDLDSLG